MKAKKVMALLIAAAFAAPLGAQSGSATVQPKDLNPGAGASAGGFATMDRNNDGYISRDEARDATWSNRFSELDKDNDGRLSADELAAMEDSGSGTTGGMGGPVGGLGDKPGQKQ